MSTLEQQLAIATCLEDDAATIRDAYDMAEVADNMDAASALIGHFMEREQDIKELVALSEHALTPLRAHGYNIAADHLAEQIAKVKGEKK